MISLAIGVGLLVAGVLSIAALPWTEGEIVATTTAARRVGAALRRLLSAAWPRYAPTNQPERQGVPEATG